MHTFVAKNISLAVGDHILESSLNSIVYCYRKIYLIEQQAKRLHFMLIRFLKHQMPSTQLTRRASVSRDVRYSTWFIDIV
jgi:hypothetical protein